MPKPRSEWAPLRQSTFLFNEYTDHVNFLCTEAVANKNHWYGVSLDGLDL